MSYQAWVYREGVLPRICTSPQQYAAALASGWRDTPVPVPDPDQPGERIGLVSTDPVLSPDVTVTVTPEPDHTSPPIQMLHHREKARKTKVYT